MPTILSALPRQASNPGRLAEGGDGRERTMTAEMLVCVLGGSGLLAWGLLRGSWFGLATAVMGGLLLQRGLARPRLRHTSSEALALPSAPGVCGESVATSAPVPQDQEPSDHPAAEVEQPASPLAQEDEATRPSQELSPEEFTRARVQAYFLSLERGGGSVPAYDPWCAAQDFCQASSQVIACRAQG